MKEYEIVVPLGLCFEPLNLRGVCVHAVMVEIDLSHVVPGTRFLSARGAARACVTTRGVTA
jgi:hypothetical protein